MCNAIDTHSTGEETESGRVGMTDPSSVAVVRVHVLTVESDLDLQTQSHPSWAAIAKRSRFPQGVFSVFHGRRPFPIKYYIQKWIQSLLLAQGEELAVLEKKICQFPILCSF